MRFNDAVFGLALICFALVAALATRSFPAMPGQSYGPALFPLIICSGLAVCGILLIISGFRQGAQQPFIELEEWARSARGLGSLALVLGSLIFYILLSEFLGFIPTAFSIVFILMVYLRRRWISSFVIAALATLVVHQVFSELLLVPLPWGLLEPLVF